MCFSRECQVSERAFLVLPDCRPDLPDQRRLLSAVSGAGSYGGFMSLILRVIKNVFAEALALKEENDYTI